MSLQISKRINTNDGNNGNDGNNTSDNLSGTYKVINLPPLYQFNQFDNCLLTVEPAKYINRTYKKQGDFSDLDFTDAETYQCTFNKCPYTPDNGLKFWKIQRQVYRLIDSVDKIIENTTYDTNDIECGHNVELQHYMKDLNISFEYLYANDKIDEIMHQCVMNKINISISLRTKRGKCYICETITTN